MRQVSVVNRWDENAGLRRDAIRSQVIDALEAEKDKDDRFDGRTLARLARIDPQLLAQVQHRSAQAQAHLMVIRARAGLVRAWTSLINTARGLTKSYGWRLQSATGRHNSGHTETHDEPMDGSRTPVVPEQ
jgi:hypothetical protein